MTNTTWDPNAESGMNLSNGDLTATVTATGVGGRCVRSTTSRTTGKAYVEFTMGQVTANGLTRIGIGNASWNYNQTEVLGRDANSLDYESDGSIFVGNDSAGSADGFAAGDIVQLCVDFDSRLFWATRNNDGNWNGTNADPAAGTGGIGFSTVPGSCLYVGYCSAITGDAATANFGASTFSYPTPAGFSAWNTETTQTTWNPNAESGMTLSDSNLTAAVTASGTNGMSVRSLTSWSTGKAYIEFAMGQVAPNGATRIGIANSSWNYTQSEMLGRDANSFDYESGGAIFVAGAIAGSAESFTAGDIVQLCADFGAQLFWIAKNNDGNWNGTHANPAAGTGGIGFSGIPGPWFVGYCSAIAGDNATANFGASAFRYAPPSGFSAWGGGFGGGNTMPAAVRNLGWTNYKNWRFGRNAGNNVKSLSDLAAAGWVKSHDDNNTDDEFEVFNMDMTDGNLNVQMFQSWCDFLAIWDGGPISAPPSGSITSMQVELPLDLVTHSDLTSIAYVEGTFKCADVPGAWPAWWTIGHHMGGTGDSVAWGPEIDVMEIMGASQTSEFFATLHAAYNPVNQCFLKDFPPPNIPPGIVDYDNSEKGSVKYDDSGAGNYNLGAFLIKGVVDASDGFHRYGCLIEPDHTISIWIDDQKIGHFLAAQYCHDNGVPVALQLLIDLALFSDNNTFNPENFGGVNNTTPTNRFRLSMKEIQIWGPPPP